MCACSQNIRVVWYFRQCFYSNHPKDLVETQSHTKEWEREMEGEISISSSIIPTIIRYTGTPPHLSWKCANLHVFTSITIRLRIYPRFLNPWRDSKHGKEFEESFRRISFSFPAHSVVTCQSGLALGLECGPPSYTSCQVSWQLIEKLDLFQGICQQQ